MTESFGRYVSAIYADRFDNHAGQKLEVVDEQPVAAGVVVRSRITKANGEPVDIGYLLHRSGENWLIADVYLDGAISVVATRRSEFAAILKGGGSMDCLPRSTTKRRGSFALRSPSCPSEETRSTIKFANSAYAAKSLRSWQTASEAVTGSFSLRLGPQNVAIAAL